MKTLCFTGHRPQKVGGYDDRNPTARWVKTMLRRTILSAYLNGYHEFIAGGALGVDTWAAEIINEHRTEMPEARLLITVPFPGQDSRWPEASRERYRKMLEFADEVMTLTNYDSGNIPFLLHTRNHWMVDHADLVVAVWDGEPGGGTSECVRYAQSKGKRVYQLNPTTRWTGWAEEAH